MANSRDPRMAKVYDKKSIYYHCVSLKKLLSQEEQALMQPLEDSLRQQDKMRPPYGECHHCHDRGHWIGDCPEAQKLREQQMFTDKKPTYGQCYICGLEDHWAPNCHKREEHLMNDKESQPKLVDYSDSESSDDEDNIKPPQRKRRAMVIYSDDEDEEEQQSSESTEKQQSSVSTEKQQSSVSTEKPSRKRRLQMSLISVLREDAWILVQRRQLNVQRQGRSLIVSFVNQPLTRLDPVQRW